MLKMRKVLARRKSLLEMRKKAFKMRIIVGVSARAGHADRQQSSPLQKEYVSERLPKKETPPNPHPTPPPAPAPAPVPRARGENRLSKIAL